MITISNHGPLIVSTDYWGSEAELAGKVFASCNAGDIRLLIPRTHRQIIQDMRVGSRYAILSRGPWPDAGLADAVEILFEDGSDAPFALHLSPTSFDLLPAEPPADRQWVVSVWDCKKGRPHKAIERACHWRRVPKIPWLKPLEGP